MYRIIYLCLPGQEDALKEHNFGILEGDYETREEAIVAVHKYAEVDYANFIDGDEELAEITTLETEESDIDGEYELDTDIVQYGDLVYRTEYKVVC